MANEFMQKINSLLLVELLFDAQPLTLNVYSGYLNQRGAH